MNHSKVVIFSNCKYNEDVNSNGEAGKEDKFGGKMRSLGFDIFNFRKQQDTQEEILKWHLVTQARTEDEI